MYEHEYDEMYRLESSYWWYVARRSLAVDLLRDELSRRDSARILDVGCGTGANAKAFARVAQTMGIDMSVDALHFCQARGINSVALSPVETLPFAGQTFDVVTALDVLEHTDDDLSALREIHRVCAKQGLLLATVPAYGFLWSEHDEALKHRRRYTAHELRNKLTITGFEVVRTSYFITSLFFPILALPPRPKKSWQNFVRPGTRNSRPCKWTLPTWPSIALPMSGTPTSATPPSSGPGACL